MAASIQSQARMEIEATLLHLERGLFLKMGKTIFERGYGDTMCPSIEFNRLNPDFEAKFHAPSDSYQIRRK